MTVLSDYDQFDGLHWETGTLRNFYAYRGLKAPHTNEPFTEALLMGVSGGAVMGYFSFAYEGYDPHVVILTRNTFDPLDTILTRLGIPQDIRQTGSPDKAVENLLDALDNGLPGIIWADAHSLPYNGLPYDERMWAIMPILVYGYDEAADQVWIADRARVPLAVTTGDLAAARSRIKKYKHRLLTLDFPKPEKLISAVQLGIWDCIKLFTEPPPKGSRSNFGFAAYERWADLLVKPKMRLSWAKVFPPGVKMYAGLTSTFNHVVLFGKNGGAEREMYADFLEEASVLLDRAALHEVAADFRRSARAWDEVAAALLPGDVALLGETRALMVRKHELFLAHGGEALEQTLEIGRRLEQIREEVKRDFPLDDAGVGSFCENLRAKILAVREIEQAAIAGLKDAMR